MQCDVSGSDSAIEARLNLSGIDLNKTKLCANTVKQTLTIRDEDTPQHSAKDNTQCNALEAKRWHVPTGSKSAILLLKDTKTKDNLMPWQFNNRQLYKKACFSAYVFKGPALNFVF